METQPLIVERLLAAPASTIWEALIDNEKIKRWYFQLESFEPRVGFEFSFAGQGAKGEKYIHHCLITAVESEKKLSYTWRYENYPGDSEVSFELFPEGFQTLVRITHSGLETMPQDSPDFAPDSFSKGWNYILGESLKKFVEEQ
ncbi:SRPBCC family protein [Mucilaginibacter psychrotolerans]|uniref:SRPBCC domain-containing protein n=1 Tax=Mucilaginibacter psychrotolerans TaxID=1524096 RepID=A0A4Y8S801_9SPHI|nr:SRPBCC domain-containing protein [Mucilaginibacter psychrotolerans]TFF34761.1 SRPBCC domain-containing protein [Mucilaginibacter psychrotolerans]